MPSSSTQILAMLRAMSTVTHAATDMLRDNLMERGISVYVSESLATCHDPGIQYQHPRCWTISMLAKNLFHESVCLAVSDKARSSASVLVVVMVACFEAFKSMGPP